MKTFADQIIAFNESLKFGGKLPEGIRIMNPFKEDAQVLPLSSAFYKKYYNDTRQRRIILGINPGRFGAGVTGVPFTDTKRLREKCGIDYRGKETHEPSSVFVYEIIEAYGGLEKFYNDFYISAVCPLGFTKTENGKEKNYNYYDSTQLANAVYNFSVECIRHQLAFGIDTNVCYCFGTGKNEKYLRAINDKYCFFKEIVALEHPRFIMQYKAKTMQTYIDKYLEAFRK
ncbi:MAG TPA: uracil-DNA glycosylase family protein [Bacteroidales bacterium]|nr:uracil-DNA glycosylase family protein [Bacteroidales bacterium]